MNFNDMTQTVKETCFDVLIESPPKNECGGLDSGNDKYSSIIRDENMPETDKLHVGTNSNSASDLSVELSISPEDIEWISTILEDPYSDCGSQNMKEYSSIVNHGLSSNNQVPTPCLVSVMESRGSSSNYGSALPQLAGSKISVAETLSPDLEIQLKSPSLSFTDPPVNSSRHKKKAKTPGPGKYKRKKNKLTFSSVSPGHGDRKCTHCEVTESPQWRTGPMGRNTLCNACGIRYKSGRLFPEYRPIASPSFVPELHSNIHRKVLKKQIKDEILDVFETPVTFQPELILHGNPK